MDNDLGMRLCDNQLFVRPEHISGYGKTSNISHYQRDYQTHYMFPLKSDVQMHKHVDSMLLP